jgi:SAM-dependent methyltransferase
MDERPATRAAHAAGARHARAAYEAFAPHYDAFTADHDYEAWTTTLERMARAHGLRGTRLLDVACGTGKSFLPFLDRGYEVTACDISPAMAERAAAKARDRARVEVHDMRALPRLGAFDLVCCLDDAVNYVLSAQELEATFAGLARNLAPGGVVVFDANSLAAYRMFFATMTVLAGDGRVLVWDGHAAADFAAGGLAQATLEAICRRDDGTWWRERSDHLQRHHPRETVERALQRAGLRAAAVYGMHLDGSTTDAFDELDNSKAVYIACGPPLESSRPESA